MKTRYSKVCLIPGCPGPGKWRGQCQLHDTKLRRLWSGDSPLISEQSLIDLGYLLPEIPRPPRQNIVQKITPSMEEFLNDLNIPILRRQR